MKFKIIILLCFVISSTIYGQDTIYLNNKKQEVLEINANYYKIHKSGSKEEPYFDQTYLLNGQLKFETVYKNSKKQEKVKHSVWYDSGQLYLEINYRKNKIDGEFLAFYKNGSKKRQDFYKKGKMLEGNCWDQEGNILSFFKYEEQPEFPGGSKEFVHYLKNNISNTNNTSTKIVVKFFIDCKGKVVDLQLIKKSNDLKLDSSVVVTIMNMPNWKPAKQDGKTVGVWRTLPLTF
jgi:antitoxin component YwqK of YwqJK toxin-antitoxin module